MFKYLKKLLPKWLKFLVCDLSWDAIKTWVGGHITILLPTTAICFIAQGTARNLYTCLNSPLQCITSNYSDIILVIGFVLMLLSILISNKESERKFIELSKKISAKEEVRPHKISEEVKKEIKTVVARYYHILATERKILHLHQSIASQYFEEIPGSFNKISQHPEVVEDEKLFQIIENARNRAALILHMARKVVSDQKWLTGEEMTNHEYLQGIEPIFNEFQEYKDEIFQHLKSL